MPAEYTSNPDLKTILPEEEWRGTPLDVEGNFVNHEYPFIPKFSELWKWQRETNPQKAEKKQDTWRLQASRDHDWLTNGKDCIVWLGHSTFFFRLNGVTLLTDPVFGSPSVLMKRYVDFPLDPTLLKNLDFILLSHDHRDHLDEPSLQLLAKQNPDAQYLTGLKMNELLQKITSSKHIQTAGWYQQYALGDTPLEVYFLPARHWSRRGLWDINQRLWGAFVLKTNDLTIYFSGDTGYGSHLKEVGTIFPNIDYCIIGIGAYKPEWFMSPAHISPTDAVKAFHEMQAKHLIPMHYGTFDLSDEPLSEPPAILQQLKDEGKIKGNLCLPQPGEAIYL
ncbi:MAG: MBL fold metallo-hydrolase [Saprospiraceae bacterium]